MQGQDRNRLNQVALVRSALICARTKTLLDRNSFACVDASSTPREGN